jgi:hypothetical protein
MLLVRFSFCEYGSIVCGSPALAQRKVCAATGRAAAAASRPMPSQVFIARTPRR